MGVAVGRHVRSDAVIVTTSRSLTCVNVAELRLHRVERSVRIEGVRGSNPLSSTKSLQVRAMFDFLRARRGSHCGSQVVGFRYG